MKNIAKKTKDNHNELFKTSLAHAVNYKEKKKLEEDRKGEWQREKSERHFRIQRESLKAILNYATETLKTAFKENSDFKDYFLRLCQARAEENARITLERGPKVINKSVPEGLTTTVLKEKKVGFDYLLPIYDLKEERGVFYQIVVTFFVTDDKSSSLKHLLPSLLLERIEGLRVEFYQSTCCLENLERIRQDFCKDKKIMRKLVNLLSPALMMETIVSRYGGEPTR